MSDMGNPAQRYVEWYRTGHLSPYISAVKAAGIISMIEVAQPAGDMSDPPSSDLVLQRLVGRSAGARVNFGAGKTSGVFGPGDWFLAPADVTTDIQVHDSHIVRCFALPKVKCFELLPEELDRRMLDFGALHRGAFASSLLDTLTDHLWMTGAEQSPISALLAEGALMTMLSEFARLSSGHLDVARAPAGKDWRVRNAIEYLEARLHEDVRLTELAAVVALSPSHVAALFKTAFGMPPHQWVMQRRIERACELLLNPRVTITDAALACGFASSQHMATVFRKRLGVTPTEWRRGRVG